jgi:hypothetical protein
MFSEFPGGGSTNHRRFQPMNESPDLRPPSLKSHPAVGAPVFARLIPSLSALAHAARSLVVDAAKTSSCLTEPFGQLSMNGNLRMSAKAWRHIGNERIWQQKRTEGQTEFELLCDSGMGTRRCVQKKQTAPKMCMLAFIAGVIA